MNASTDPVLQIVHFTLAYTELVLQVGSICSSTLFFVAFFKVRIFHNNLRILLFNHILIFLVVILTRIQLSVTTLIGAPLVFVIQFLYVVALYCCGLNFVMIIVERVIAYLLVNRYEHMFEHIPLLGLILAFSTWYLSFAIIFLVWKAFLNAAGIFYLLAFLYCAAVAVFVVLLLASRCRYEEHLKRIQTTGYGHSLSDRYQLTENVRSARLLTFFVGTTSLFSTIVVLLALCFFLNPPGQARATIYDLFAIFLALNTLLAPMAGIVGHDKLRAVVKRLIVSNKSSIAFEPKTINGRRLIIGVQESRQIYFDMFQQAMNGPQTR